MAYSSLSNLFSRRRFIQSSRNVLALMGAAQFLGTSTEAFGEVKTTGQSTSAGVDYYDKLGVTKIINAAGTYTDLTSAVMPPSVRAAVAQAALHPVRLEEL